MKSATICENRYLCISRNETQQKNNPGTRGDLGGAAGGGVLCAELLKAKDPEGASKYDEKNRLYSLMTVNPQNGQVASK